MEEIMEAPQGATVDARRKNGSPVLFLRPVKRKCMVKGCRNTASIAVSRNPEFGNTVILCGECIRALSRERGGER